MPIVPHEMFHPTRVIELQATEKEAVLRELGTVLGTSDNVLDPGELIEKIIERERTLSTGVGIGVAVPHVKIASVQDFVVAVGISEKGVDFQAIDDLPVHIVVMIGCHSSQSGDYLKVLSTLVRALKDESFRQRVRSAESPGAIVDLFIGQFVPAAR
ncbi:MAG: PTS sugar transporter subunit IIA [Sumerlaeia bacterium]